MSGFESFDTKLGAEKWARDLDVHVDRFDAAPNKKVLESTTLRPLLEDTSAKSRVSAAEQPRKSSRLMCWVVMSSHTGR
jgi:hypothetical protein